MTDIKNCWMKGKCKGTCDSFCPKLFKLDFLFDEALMSQSQRKHLDLYVDQDGTDLDQFKRLSEIEKSIETFVNDGSNLYIHSSTCGCGKTSWALRLVQAYFDKIWYKCDFTCKALFIHVPRFLISLKDNISHQSEYVEHIKENILNADIVIWDEIATKSLTSFEFEHLLTLINARIDLNKSNIYTSNINNDELANIIGDRLYSRIVNNSEDVELFGMDKRGAK